MRPFEILNMIRALAVKEKKVRIRKYEYEGRFAYPDKFALGSGSDFRKKFRILPNFDLVESASN